MGEDSTLTTVKKMHVIGKFEDIRKAPSVGSEESFLQALVPRADKDDMYLTHLDRSLTESLALQKLLGRVKRQHFLHRTVREAEMSEGEQVRVIENQNRKIEAVAKVVSLDFKLSCILVDGKVSQADVPSGLRKWIRFTFACKEAEI